RAIAKRFDLDTDGKRLVWESTSLKSERVSSKTFQVHRCIRMGIRPVGKTLYLTIEPTFWVPAPSDEDTNDAQTVLKGLLGYQHNKEYNDDLNYWREKLGSTEVAVDYPPGSAAFEFVVNLRPAYATIVATSGKKVPIASSFEPLIHH